MSEITRAIHTLEAHIVPKNRNAVIKLRDALIEEVRYLDADRFHGEQRQEARSLHARQAVANWKAASDLFKGKE